MIHAEHRRPMRRVALLLALLVVAMVLAPLLLPAPGVKGIASYAPLHTLLETVAIVVAALVFATGIHTRNRALPGSVAVLACAFLGVALLDFSHMLSFEGMPDYVTPSSAEKAINFWLAARLLAALAILVVACSSWQTVAGAGTRAALLVLVLGVTAAAHVAFLYFPARMPLTFSPASGLSAFKVAAEWVFIVLHLAAAAVLWARMRTAQAFDAPALLAATCTMALSGVFFTLYGNVNDAYNLLGHIYKVIGYGFLYRAVFIETVARPMAQLRAAQAQLRATLQTIPDLWWLKDLQGTYIDCNPAVEKLLKLPRTAIIGKRNEDLLPADKLALHDAQDQQALAAGAPSRFEGWLNFPSSGFRGLFEVTKTPVRDAQGQLIGLLGMARDVTAVRHSEQALRSSEQRLQQAIRAAQIGIFEHDHSRDTLYCSEELRRRYGIDADEPVSLALALAAVHPDDAERVAAALQRAHDPAGDGLFDIDYRFVRRDGEVRQLVTRSQTFFEGEGTTRRKVRTVGAALDVTETKRTEVLLREREEVLLQAQRLAGLGHWRWNSGTGESLWSDETYRILGVDPARFVAGFESFMALIHPDDRAKVAQARADALAGVRAYDIEYRALTPAGQLKHLHGRATVLADGTAGGPQVLLGTVLDITERRVAEQALRLRDEALRTSLTAVAMSDLQGRLSYVNTAFLQMWGLDDESQALGRPVDSFWFDAQPAREVMGALLQGSGQWTGELVALRKDGAQLDVAVHAGLARGAGGEPIGMMASFLDVTQRNQARLELQRLNTTLEVRVQVRTRDLESALQGLRSAQDELVRSEKMASLGSLVAGVAHELNTPIGNAVLVASTLSGRQREFERGLSAGAQPDKLAVFLNATRSITAVLERNLQRAAELIGSFKQIAVDQSSYQRRTFDLAEVVQEIALTLSPTLRMASVRLLQDVPPDLALDSFPGPLGQVLINLVNNTVVHAFEPGSNGTVRISAEALAAGRVRLRVADDGRGIATEHLKQIFDPFFTTKLGQGGSGLGLHIAYTLTTGLLGGRIDVQSAPGQGTVFSIELPCVAPAAHVDESERQPAVPVTAAPADGQSFS